MIPVSLAMAEFAIAIIVCLICGYTLGYSFGNNKRKPIGTLRVDSSDPDGPYLFLEMDSSNGGVGWISKQKYIVLKVLVKDYISHE